MADIVADDEKMNDLEIASDSPVTEALMTKKGANINWLLNAIASMLTRIVNLEGLKTGASYSGSTAVNAAGVAFLSFPVTLGANDSVELSMSGQPSGGTFENSLIFTVGSGSSTSVLRWRRDAAVVLTDSATVSGGFGGTVMTKKGVWTDKPGAGTYTYTLFASNSANSGFVTGNAVMKVIRG